MTEKLHVATRKLLMPTRTGIFCFSKNGASTGSGATKSSIQTNKIMKMAASVIGMNTEGEDHYGVDMSGSR